MPPARSRRTGRNLRGNPANQLSIADARHILKAEGGELKPVDVALRVFFALLVSTFSAWAIATGQATAWHLALPMLAEYAALLLVLPVVAIFVKHPELTKEARRCPVVLIPAGLLFAAWVAHRASALNHSWLQQAGQELQNGWRWIHGSRMHWPVLLSVTGTLTAIPARIRHLRKHGPPFLAVSLGCGMRVAVLFLGLFLTPLVLGAKLPVVWVLWTLLLVSEGLTLLMHWDIQKRLKRLDTGGRIEGHRPLP